MQNDLVVKVLWLTATSHERFLQQSPDLYCSLGYDPTVAAAGLAD